MEDRNVLGRLGERYDGIPHESTALRNGDKSSRRNIAPWAGDGGTGSIYASQAMSAHSHDWDLLEGDWVTAIHRVGGHETPRLAAIARALVREHRAGEQGDMQAGATGGEKESTGLSSQMVQGVSVRGGQFI